MLGGPRLRGAPGFTAFGLWLLAVVAPGLISLASAGPELPPAERPTYAIGDTWIRNDGAYELSRIENDRYIFTAGPGRVVHLTKDLGIARVERDKIFFEFDPPLPIEWPLKVGNWGTTSSTRRAVGDQAGKTVNITWRVEDTEEVTIAGQTLKAFRIRLNQGFPATGRVTTLTMWYSPETKRLLKTEGSDFETFKFVVTGFGRAAAATDLAAPRPPLAVIHLQSATAELKRISGRVEGRRKGQTAWTVAATGLRLGEADELRTTTDATAEVGLPGGNSLFLAEDTHLIVVKLEHDRDSGARSFLFHLVAGKVRAYVVPTDRAVPGNLGNFIISTQTGSAAVNGAAVAVVSHETATQRSFVAALQPAKILTPPAIIRYIDLSATGVVTLTAGMFMTQVGTGAPSAPAPVTALPPALKDALSPSRNVPTP